MGKLRVLLLIFLGAIPLSVMSCGTGKLFGPTFTTTATPTYPFTPIAKSSPLPTLTMTYFPTLSPATPAGTPAAYHLVLETADQAEEIITRMEQAVLAFGDASLSTGDLHPPYRVVWYAAWDALAHFPNDPRADKWCWKMAYYMALSGEGDEATEIYIDKIANALNQQGIKPQDLPCHTGSNPDI